jgi:PIN domain nuclease of toxin-antitoxin system
MILLDTCALIWLNDDRSKFSKKVISLITDNLDSLFVSSISFMEIGIKSQKDKLHIPGSLEEWSNSIVETYSLNVIPVSRDIAVKAPMLPDVHKDPFDRIIIATAIVNKMKIITADKVFKNYGQIKVVW